MINEHHYVHFRNNYAHLKSVSGQEIRGEDGIRYRYEILSPDLRRVTDRNCFIMAKKNRPRHCLNHGLSDSPRYMADVSNALRVGLNVFNFATRPRRRTRCRI
ncbi:MAG: hypothetical protein R2788_05520 [Saprospiraceae bacterium]